MFEKEKIGSYQIEIINEKFNIKILEKNENEINIETLTNGKIDIQDENKVALAFSKNEVTIYFT